MLRYILKRIGLMVPVVIGVSFLVYVFMSFAPGNVLDTLANDLSEEELAVLIHEYGYDRSVFYRYGLFIRDFLKGSLGYSYIYKTDVMTLYLQRLPATLELAGAAMLLTVLFSLPMGILAARRKGRAADSAVTAVSVLGMSMPNFWLGVLFILLFSQSLHLLPSGSNTEGLRSLILPAVTLSTGLTAALTRTTRGAMLEVQGRDYIRTARAKGLENRMVYGKHALKNALVPVLTVFGSQLGGVLGGAVITENVFSWPGVGRLLVDAIKERDTQLVTGCLVMTALVISAVQLAVDVLYAAVDPRIAGHLEGSGAGREGL